MKCSVEINSLRMRAYHGVLPEERVVGNDFSLSIRIDYPFHEALLSDSLGSTINYAAVVDIAEQVMKEPSNLLEHVVGRLRDALLSSWPEISGGYIKLAKLSPPIHATLDSVAVSIEW